MTKRNVNTFDPFFSDLEDQSFSAGSDEKSKSELHSNRFSGLPESSAGFENSRNLTKTEEN